MEGEPSLQEPRARAGGRGAGRRVLRAAGARAVLRLGRAGRAAAARLVPRVRRRAPGSTRARAPPGRPASEPAA